MKNSHDSLWSSRGVAVILQIGRNTMMKRLRERGVLNSSNLPTRPYWHLFRVLNAQKFRTLTCYWTAEAIDLTKKLCCDLPVKNYYEKKFDDSFLELI